MKRNVLNKKIVLIIIGIIFIIVLLSYIFNNNIFGFRSLYYESKNSLNLLFSKSNIKTDCPIGIIPLEVELSDMMMPFVDLGEYYGKRQIEQTPYSLWADGETMNWYGTYSNFDSLCHQGKSEGENINLVYCNGFSYSKSTTPISESGVIGKTTTVSYTINLILQKESERNINAFAWGNFHVTKYKIISSECIRR